MPPSVSEKQRRFMGMEYGKAKHGEKTETGMSKDQLKDFAKKPVEGRGASSKHSPHGRKPNARGGY